MQTTASSPAFVEKGLLDTLFGERRRPHPALAAVGALAVVAGLALRFWAPSALWLDETISVNIARLPVRQIPGALAHDGAPPLYYVLLHYWMALFGTGDVAVRALSGVISVLTLPVFWIAGRRLGGRTVGWVTFFLALSSPFAINYATTTRMYSLMILLSLLGFIALSAAYEDPTPGRRVAVGAVTAALLYTHYWGVYLVLAAALWLMWRIYRSGRRRSVLNAMIIGGLVWLPWAPVFIFQTLHTGTPWTTSANPGDLLTVFADWSGSGPWGGLLMYATFLLFIIGTFGRTAAPGTRVLLADADGRVRQAEAGPAVVIELKPRPGMAPMVGIGVATLIVAVALGAVADAAFVARYTAVVLPLFLLVMGAGVAVIPGRRFRVGCVAVLVVAGLMTGQTENAATRTQAVSVATVLNAQAQPGDLVIYCPDQLGPAVDRLLTVRGVSEITFPRAIGPQRVNWVDYRQTISSTNVSQFAQAAITRVTANHTVWLVWRDGYAGLGGDCGYLQSWLNLLRPSAGVTLVHANSKTYYEFENLTRYTG
ncbi:MAG TPA: glycosyltransferase family 39 protein [Acidimicrobiales bacterium]|nr:glycosyltransferase family 39 protein [Acidimicrobiales bacterium]